MARIILVLAVLGASTLAGADPPADLDWRFQLVESDHRHAPVVALVLDADDRSHMVFQDETVGELRHVFWDGVTWQFMPRRRVRRCANPVHDVDWLRRGAVRRAWRLRAGRTPRWPSTHEGCPT